LGQKAQARDDNEVSFEEDDDSDAKVPYPPKKGGDRVLVNPKVKCLSKVENGEHFIEILDSSSDDDEDVKIIEKKTAAIADEEAKKAKSTLNKKVLGVKPIVPTNVKKEKKAAGIADEEAAKEKVLGIGEEEEKKEEEDNVDIALQTISKKYLTKCEEVERLRKEMETILAEADETKSRLQAEIMQLTEEHKAVRSNNEELRKQCASESKARDEEVKSLRKKMETSVAEKQQAAETNTRLQAEIMQLKEERDNLRGNFQRFRVSCFDISLTL
jgi:chromosome segregation ATPase